MAIASGAVVSATRVIALSGTVTGWPPLAPPQVDVAQPAGAAGGTRAATSSTTRYWLSCVKMVETCRWPKAS